jgi:hypothetical protein
MPASVLYMSMSVDGHIAGPNDEPGQSLSRGGGCDAGNAKDVPVTESKVR